MSHAQRLLVILGLGIAGLGVTFGIAQYALPEAYRTTPVYWLDLGFLLAAQAALMAYQLSMLTMDARSDTMPVRLSTTLYFRGYVVATGLVFLLGPVSPWRTLHGAGHALLLLVLLGYLARALLGGDYLKRLERQEHAREQGYQRMVLAAQSVGRALDAAPAVADLKAPLTKLTEAITYADRGSVSASVPLEAQVVDQLRDLAAALDGATADKKDALGSMITATQRLLDERRDLLKMTK